MLCLKKERKLSVSGRSVYRWYCEIEVSLRDQDHGPRLKFKIDTGADYTLLCIDHALGLGLSSDVIRKQGQRIKLRSASGQEVYAYLYPIRARLTDDFGGWAEWDAEFAFADMPAQECLAGLIGVLDFFDPKSRGGFLDLEPIPQDPATHFNYNCKHPHGIKTGQTAS